MGSARGAGPGGDGGGVVRGSGRAGPDAGCAVSNPDTPGARAAGAACRKTFAAAGIPDSRGSAGFFFSGSHQPGPEEQRGFAGLFG